MFTIYEASSASTSETYSFPLNLVVERNGQEPVELLIQNEADVNIQNEYGLYPIHMAVLSKNKEIVEFLIDNGADVNVQNNERDLALHLAMGKTCEEVRENTEIIKLLIQRGTDVYLRNADYVSPLLIAIRLEDLEIVEFMIETCKKTFCEYSLHRTSMPRDGFEDILYHATTKGNIDIVKFLVIRRSVQVAHGDYFRGTFSESRYLFWSIKFAFTEMADFLIDRGANMNADHLSRSREVLLGDALGIARDTIVKPFFFSTWSEITVGDPEEVVELFIDRGADLNLIDRNDAIKLAALFKFPDVIHMLLTKKNQNENNQQYQYPAIAQKVLNEAISNAELSNKEEIVKLLRDHKVTRKIPIKNRLTIYPINIIQNYIQIHHVVDLNPQQILEIEKEYKSLVDEESNLRTIEKLNLLKSFREMMEIKNLLLVIKEENKYMKKKKIGRKRPGENEEIMNNVSKGMDVVKQQFYGTYIVDSWNRALKRVEYEEEGNNWVIKITYSLPEDIGRGSGEGELEEEIE